MSWLLVALIPGLLMLATFGLDRVEAGLRQDMFSAADVAELLGHAEAVDVDTLARDGIDSALHGAAQRRDERDSATGGLSTVTPAEGLPTREYFQHHTGHVGNPGFQQTRHANTV
ncbi:hypothetical protein ACAG25_17135 [Mycobacterium sp. pV006]|uniref:hypothetical protein n=1 Tax=Mycobacterium sp. pV006 TaxID=3238983 RepID=UPI00351BAE10